MGNASTKERSLTPPHGGHHHLSSTNLSSRRNGGGGNGGPSSSGRLSSTLLSSGAGGSESYSGRGRSRHNLENSLFGLGLTSSRETRERDKEAEREAREQRKIEREKERLKERERSLREESVDGGFLVTQGVYTGTEDFKDKIVRHLMIERRLAPFFKGLDDHESDWTDAQLVAAVKGLPIPAADVEIQPETKSRSPSRTPGPSDSANNLTVPIASRSRAQSYTSEGSNRSATSTPSSFGFSSRTRAKTLSISAPRNPTLANTAGPAEINEPSRTVDGRPIEAVLYKSATECPICFLYYPPYLNKTRCCDQDICSECFVQIKRPDPHHPEHHEGDQPAAADANGMTGTADQLISEPATCPFCVEPEFGIIYTPPPFRRGLMFANAQSQNSLPSPMGFGFSDGSSPLPGHYSGTPPSFPSSPITPTGKRRMALGVNNPEVVTTDRIRPDWAQKLATARSHAARRAAAATALHTAAYLMGPHNAPASSNSNTSSGFSSRRLIRRAVRDGGGGNNGSAESDTPSPAQSGTGTPRDGQHGAAGLTSLASFTERMGGNPRDGPSQGLPQNPHRDGSLFSERRNRVIDLEEMMLMEAIRLSLAEEEERKRKEELEEQRKRLVAPSISTRNGSNISLASSSGSVEGKGKSVDRSPYPQDNNIGASSSSAVTASSRPQLPTGGGSTGSVSGASDSSSFRSLPGNSDDDEGTPSENAGSGTETMFNFRSLAEMIVEEDGARVDIDGRGEFLGSSGGDSEREGKEGAETAEHVEDVAHGLENGKNVAQRTAEAS